MGKVIPFVRRSSSGPAAPGVRREVLPLAGHVGPCKRCGAPCAVAEMRNADARFLRHAKVPEGYCASCAVTEWLFVMGLRETSIPNPAVLRLPHVQEQMAVILRNAHADMVPAEIDWEQVIANWNLPFVGAGGKSIDPSKGLRTAMRGARPPRKRG
jgi:hypothetical protein